MSGDCLLLMDANQWHCRWIFLGNWSWNGDTSNFSPVLWAPSWWLMGPGIRGSILTWPRTLYVTPDYSYKVWDISLIFLALTLQCLIPFHLSLFVFLKSPPPMVPSGCSLLPCPLVLPVALSSTHPHWAASPLPLPTDCFFLSPDLILTGLGELLLEP